MTIRIKDEERNLNLLKGADVTPLLPISYLDEIAKNPLLYDEKNFAERTEAIDFIEFHIAEFEHQLVKADHPGEHILLKNSAEKVKADLELVDIKLFEKLRANIRSGLYTGKEFIGLFKTYVDFDLGDEEHQEEPGYDNLDLFINRLIHPDAIPEQTRDLEPEMVYYQKTPARIVFELVEKLKFKKSDVFLDLGSGLGQVAILVNLLTGVTTRGIEFEPAFCEYAMDCASVLNLNKVTFVTTDARDADYSKGSIFFMFTPFKGEIMQQVLRALRNESLKRKIKIVTYGPCTAEVALQNWLQINDPENNHVYKVCIFASL
jgi:precorrin-6B methylase 2